VRTVFTRRRIETGVAAILAAATAVVGIAGRDEQRVGPKYLGLERVGSFRQPVQVVQPPRSDALFVVERPGRIRVVEGRRVRARPFLDIRGRVDDSGRGRLQGLLSLAFAPDYQQSGRFYLSYTDRRDNLRIFEYRRAASSDHLADRFSAREVLSIPQPTGEHHGGMLVFGPDSQLYIGSGDGGPSGDPDGSAQDLSVLRGKILRIDPERAGGNAYRIPRDNPFVGLPGRDEIYAYGLRTPRRFSFDRVTGALAIGDGGGERFEEVDYVPAGKGTGANFGWPAYEGFARLRGGVPKRETMLPVLAYPHGPGCSVTGGHVVRDPSLTRIAGRELVGRYLFGDYCSGRIFAFRPRPRKAGKERRLRFRIPDLTSFGEDNAGRIYLVSRRGGVWRLVPRRKDG
jgi:hypothetical protein